MIELPLIFIGILTLLIIFVITMGLISAKKASHYRETMNEEDISSDEKDERISKFERFNYFRRASVPLAAVFTIFIAFLVFTEIM